MKENLVVGEVLYPSFKIMFSRAQTDILQEKNLPLMRNWSCSKRNLFAAGIEPACCEKMKEKINQKKYTLVGWFKIFIEKK